MIINKRKKYLKSSDYVEIATHIYKNIKGIFPGYFSGCKNTNHLQCICMSVDYFVFLGVIILYLANNPHYANCGPDSLESLICKTNKKYISYEIIDSLCKNQEIKYLAPLSNQQNAETLSINVTEKQALLMICAFLEKEYSSADSQKILIIKYFYELFRSNKSKSLFKFVSMNLSKNKKYFKAIHTDDVDEYLKEAGNSFENVAYGTKNILQKKFLFFMAEIINMLNSKSTYFDSDAKTYIKNRIIVWANSSALK